MEKQENALFEIADNVTAEQLSAMFFDKDALLNQPEPVFRLDNNGHRYYYTYENGEPMFYMSVTTMIRATMPTPESLIKWKADLGYDEANRIASDRAAYGTFLHEQIAELLINKVYSLDLVREKIRDYIKKEKLPEDFVNYADDIKKDVLAFAQFIRDYHLKPLAIELVLTNKRDGYAGAIDLVAEIDVSKTKAGIETGTVIIDFKSGRKGFYESYEIQLAAYRETWNMNFPQHRVERVYNWSPKDWRKAPAYNFKDQTDSPNLQKLDKLVELAKIDELGKMKDITLCRGVITFANDLKENIQTYTLKEVIENANRKNNEPNAAEDGSAGDRQN